MSTTTELLCHGLPEELITYFHSVSDLAFEDQPAYERYRTLFRNASRKLMR